MKISFFVLTLIICESIIGLAQQNDIALEKKKVIAEIIVLTKADKQINQLTEKMLAAYENSPPIRVEDIVDRNAKINSTQKLELQKVIDLRQQSFTRKFRERFPQVIDYPKYIENSIYPLYDKYFSESELLDIAAFYKTPTGQKVIETMPTLLADSIEMVQTELIPKFIKLKDEIIEEELKVFAQEERRILNPPQRSKQTQRQK
jgi:hypothetical protein